MKIQLRVIVWLKLPDSGTFYQQGSYQQLYQKVKKLTLRKLQHFYRSALVFGCQNLFVYVFINRLFINRCITLASLYIKWMQLHEKRQIWSLWYIFIWQIINSKYICSLFLFDDRRGLNLAPSQHDLHDELTVISWNGS